MFQTNLQQDSSNIQPYVWNAKSHSNVLICHSVEKKSNRLGNISTKKKENEKWSSFLMLFHEKENINFTNHTNFPIHKFIQRKNINHKLQRILKQFICYPIKLPKHTKLYLSFWSNSIFYWRFVNGLTKSFDWHFLSSNFKPKGLQLTCIKAYSQFVFNNRQQKSMKAIVLEKFPRGSLLRLLLFHIFMWDLFTILQSHGKSICRSFHILAQFPFTTNERELDYYHQMVNIWAASRVAKRLSLKRN